MPAIVHFSNESPVVLDVPEGTRFIYICRDTPTNARLITHDLFRVAKWMNNPARLAPWVEPRELVTCEPNAEATPKARRFREAA